MFDPTSVKNEYTRKLIAALFALQILEIVSCFESSEYIELMFRVNKESQNMWQGLIKRFLFSNVGRLFVNKKYLLKEGELSFAWTITVTSKNLEDDVLQAADYIRNNIAQADHTPASRPQQSKPRPKTFSEAKKQNVSQPKVVGHSSQGPIIHWEMPLPHTTMSRNSPKDGSTKGAYSIDPDGASREFIKKAHPHSRSGRIK